MAAIIYKPMAENIIYSNIQAKSGVCPPPDLPTLGVLCTRSNGNEYCCPDGWSCDPNNDTCGFGGCCPP